MMSNKVKVVKNISEYIFSQNQLKKDKCVPYKQLVQSIPFSDNMSKIYQLFFLLELNDIVGLHNFSCCKTCGHKYFWEKIALERIKQNQNIIGYVYYHKKLFKKFQKHFVKSETSEPIRKKVKISNKDAPTRRPKIRIEIGSIYENDSKEDVDTIARICDIMEILCVDLGIILDRHLNENCVVLIFK